MLVEALKVIVPPVARSFVGWLHKSWEDGIVDKYEIKRGAATVLRTTLLSLGLYFSINYASWGLDIDLLATSSIAMLFDYLWNKWDKRNGQSGRNG